MLKETKKYLKSLALEIRENKDQRPLKNRGNRDLWEIETSILKLKYEFRSFHIASCELRGRKREDIEKPAFNNFPNDVYIRQIKERILKDHEETLRANAA